MNESFKFHIILLIFTQKILAILLATRSNGESSTCVTVYKEGGAPAVFQFPKCPHWTLSNYSSTVTIITTKTSSTAPCQSAILCALDIRIPFPGLFLSGFLLLIALIPFYLAYIAETPLSTSILFPFRPILVSCSEFSMANDFFFESLIKATRNRMAWS